MGEPRKGRGKNNPLQFWWWKWNSIIETPPSIWKPKLRDPGPQKKAAEGSTSYQSPPPGFLSRISVPRVQWNEGGKVCLFSLIFRPRDPETVKENFFLLYVGNLKILLTCWRTTDSKVSINSLLFLPTLSPCVLKILVCSPRHGLKQKYKNPTWTAGLTIYNTPVSHK